MLEKFLEITSSWEFLQQTDLPIVLYGTGNGADKIVDRFSALSIDLHGVCASDGFVRERSFRGFPVKPISYFKESLQDFVIVVGFGSNRPELTEAIRKLSKEYKVLFPCVPVYESPIFDKAFLKMHLKELETVYALLEDEESKSVFLDFLKFQICGDFEDLEHAVSEKDEIFESILKLGKTESYLDLGAYRGDTIAEFLHYTDGQYASIWAVEPNKKTFEKLEEFIASQKLSPCKAIHAAIAKGNGILHFSGDGRHNVMDENGKIEVPALSVDSLSPPVPFSYIKADVEGLEKEMLLGAKRTLEENKPKLNLALYHKSQDVFELPLLLKRLVPSYRFYLRKHPGFPFWDLNLYAL